MFGFFRRLLNLGKFKRFSKTLGALSRANYANFEIEMMTTLIPKKDEVEDEMFKEIERYGPTSEILESRKATINDVKEVYKLLMRGGGSQFIGGIYLPVAAVFLPDLLNFSLAMYLDSNRKPHEGAITRTVLALLDNLQEGKPLPIE